MSGLFRVVGIILVGLAALLAVGAAGIFAASEGMLGKTYVAPVTNLTIPTDPASIERGKHIITAIADCAGCHGADLGGGVVFEDPAIGRIVAPNLTRGKNGVGGGRSDTDFLRTIRYGVMPDGKSARVMPSDDFNHLSDSDLAAVVAYVKSVPPVDSNLPGMQFQPLGRLLMVAGQLPIMTAERINLNAPRPAPVAIGVNLEYGKYLASVACMGCHGAGLSGGQITGAPPDFPKAANLTPSGELNGWGEADFFKAMRTGVTPGGRQLIDEMPWINFRNMTDEELRALFLYVKSVPAKPAGTR